MKRYLKSERDLKLSQIEKLKEEIQTIDSQIEAIENGPVSAGELIMQHFDVSVRKEMANEYQLTLCYSQKD